MSAVFENVIRKKIETDGAMDIGTFMSLVVAQYYKTRDPFGVDGDFTTAPEISQMFGELIGAWLADMWMQMGSPAPFTVVECGPGRGTLMVDILRATRHVEGFHRGAQVCLIETSPVLQEKQRAVLREFDFIHWREAIEEVPVRGPVLLIGNEFLDALPVRQFMRDHAGWQERVVRVEDGQLCFGFEQAEKSVLSLLPALTVTQKIYEVSPARLDFAKTCCTLLEQAGGAALFIDYGYTKRVAGDTLQAVRGHQYTDVLGFVGMSDLTAHVDFVALEEAVAAQNGQFFGIVSQGEFLQALGIRRRAQVLQQAFPARSSEIDSALNRLISPSEMGDIFKVTGFGYGYNFTPAGF